jgi:hypothetical protein
MLPEQELTIPKNFNNKLDCDIFIHIQSPLKNKASVQSVFKILTADRSHEPVKARIIDSVYQPLRSLSATFIYLSHGMLPEEFMAMVKSKDTRLNDDTIVAVYFYQRQAA